jgi:hypothetical protein
MRNLRVGALLKELNKDPEFAKSFQMALRESLEKGSVLHLLCASGLPREHGFYGDLIERLLSFALPQSPEPNNVSDLLSHLFPSPDDSAWILSWGKAEFAALRHRVGASVLTDSEHTLISIPELPASFKALAAAVVSCAFSDDVLRRLRSFDNGPDLFIELMDATTTFVGRLKDFGDDNTQLITLVQDGEIFIRRIAAARARSHQILAKMESVGASLPLGDSSFSAGIETGSYFFTTPQWGTYFPIQATLSSRFDLSDKAAFILGISPGLGLVNFDNSLKPGGKDYSDTYFSFLIKPSFHLNLSDNQVLVFSPRFGTLNGNLLFAPVVGTAIPL